MNGENFTIGFGETRCYLKPIKMNIPTLEIKGHRLLSLAEIEEIKEIASRIGAETALMIQSKSEILGTKEIQKRTGVSAYTVKKWIIEGEKLFLGNYGEDGAKVKELVKMKNFTIGKGDYKTSLYELNRFLEKKQLSKELS